MKPAPCKDCEERHFKCHSECERFHEWDKAKWAEKTRHYKEMKADRMVSDVLRRDPLLPRGAKK